jgi:hypothetical protein
MPQLLREKQRDRIHFPRAARIAIESELLTVKLVKDSTIIAPDSARDAVFAWTLG